MRRPSLYQSQAYIMKALITGTTPDRRAVMIRLAARSLLAREIGKFKARFVIR